MACPMAPLRQQRSLGDQKELVTPSTAGRVFHLTSSPVPGGGMQTHHITLSAAWLQSLMGWKFSLVLASSHTDLQKKNRGFMSRKEALEI